MFGKKDIQGGSILIVGFVIIRGHISLRNLSSNKLNTPLSFTLKDCTIRIPIQGRPFCVSLLPQILWYLFVACVLPESIIAMLMPF